jgi:hypothetical protein
MRGHLDSRQWVACAGSQVLDDQVNGLVGRAEQVLKKLRIPRL